MTQFAVKIQCDVSNNFDEVDKMDILATEAGTIIEIGYVMDAN